MINKSSKFGVLLSSLIILLLVSLFCTSFSLSHSLKAAALSVVLLDEFELLDDEDDDEEELEEEEDCHLRYG